MLVLLQVCKSIFLCKKINYIYSTIVKVLYLMLVLLY